MTFSKLTLFEVKGNDGKKSILSIYYYLGAELKFSNFSLDFFLNFVEFFNSFEKEVQPYFGIIFERLFMQVKWKWGRLDQILQPTQDPFHKPISD